MLFNIIIALDDDLPPPLSVSDDEDFPHLESFLPPPPPVLTDNSVSDEGEGEGEYVPPPPPLYDDMDDADLFYDDDPPVFDVPVSLNELMDREDSFSFSSSKIIKDDGNKETDLLDNIVEQLKTLAVTTTGQRSSEDSDDESDSIPPPLPSSPPPKIANEDQDSSSLFDQVQLQNVSSQVNKNTSGNVIKALPNTSQDNNNIFSTKKLPPVNNRMPPNSKELPKDLSPTVDELPSLDELPPPIDELPSPPTLETKEKIFDFESDILPPPDSLPLPVMSPDTDNLEFEEGVLLPPPPLDQFESEEAEFEQPPITEDITLPPPAELLPPPAELLVDSHLPEPTISDEKHLRYKSW